MFLCENEAYVYALHTCGLISSPSPFPSREVLHYDDVTIPLTLSDVDSLQNKPKPQSVPGKDNYSPKHFQNLIWG